MMNRYGVFKFPVSWRHGRVAVETLKEGGSFLYRRTLGEDVTEFRLSSATELRILPVEPLLTPKELTPQLLIEFKQPVWLAGHDRMEVDLTFPIEYGVFTPRNEGWQLMDVFTMARQKFTLFGDPASGYLCKLWQSRWLQTPDQVDPDTEGWLRLRLQNGTGRSAELTRVVIPAYLMKLYCDAHRAAFSAALKVIARNLAEVECDASSPLSDGFKSVEVFSEKKFLGLGQRFIMEGRL